MSNPLAVRGTNVMGEGRHMSGRFVLNIVMGAVVVLLLFSGNVGLGLIALVVFAIVALKLGRRMAP